MYKHLVLLVLAIVFAKVGVAGDESRIQPKIILPISSVHQPADVLSPFSGLVDAVPAAVASANPASITSYSRPLAGISMEYRMAIEIGNDIQRKSDRYWLPSSAVVVWPVPGFHLGLTYRHGFSEYLDFGKLELNTLEMPEGSGEYIYPYTKTNLYSGGIILAKVIKGLFSDPDKLALAVQPTIHFFKIYH